MRCIARLRSSWPRSVEIDHVFVTGAGGGRGEASLAIRNIHVVCRTAIVESNVCLGSFFCVGFSRWISVWWRGRTTDDFLYRSQSIQPLHFTSPFQWICKYFLVTKYRMLQTTSMPCIQSRRSPLTNCFKITACAVCAKVWPWL